MKLWRLIAAVLVMALAGGAAVFGVPDLSPKLNEIPTTRPTRGDVDVRVYTIGELGPRRSMMLAAPTAATLLQIIMLATGGTLVKDGDVVIEFDREAEQFNLQQAESELAEADQELVKMQADAKVQAAQDQLNLLHARHDLRRAEIKVSGNEFVGAIEAKKNTLELDEKTRALAQLELDIKTHLAGNKAALAATQEKRAKSQIAADFAGVLDEAALEKFDGFHCSSEGHRIAAKRRCVGTFVPVHYVGTGDAGTDRHSGTKAFGKAHYVGFHAGIMVEGEHLARPSHAGLNLIDYQHNAMLIADTP